MKRQEFSTWIVRCTKCDHEFETRTISPGCSKCGSRHHIKWVTEKQK